MKCKKCSTVFPETEDEGNEEEKYDWSKVLSDEVQFPRLEKRCANCGHMVYRDDVTYKAYTMLIFKVLLMGLLPSLAIVYFGQASEITKGFLLFKGSFLFSTVWFTMMLMFIILRLFGRRLGGFKGI